MQQRNRSLHRRTWGLRPGVLVLLGVLLTGACASTPKVLEQKSGAVYFPEPPDPPRIQFLMSFSDSTVFQTEEGASFRGFFLGEEEEVGRIFKPYGVSYYDGKIFVCDTLKGLVHVFDFANNVYGALGEQGRGKLRKPINIALGPDGTRYVTDVGRGQVVVFDAEDRFLRAIGTREEWQPTDAVLVDNELFVVDVRDHEIERRDPVTGARISAFGRAGQAVGEFFKPTTIAADGQGRLYVASPINARVQIFERDGTVIDAFGQPGDALDAFTRPKGLAVGPDGLIYVVDAGFANVSIYGPDAQLYLFFGGSGAEPGQLWLPAGIAITTDGLQYFRKYVAPEFVPEYLIIVISQYGDRRVSVYAKGRVAESL